MNSLRRGRSLCYLLACYISTLYSQTPPLLEYEAEYSASANGLAARATRTLGILESGSYLLRNSLEASLAGQSLAKLEQSSEFRVEDERIQPQNYSYQLSGVSQASDAIVYNWDAGIAISSEDDESWQLELHDGVLDQLSYQEALRLALIQVGDAQSEFEFEIIDGDEIDRHRYRLAGKETLTGTLGNIETVKIERLRNTEDERVTEFWLAIEWNYLLVRLEQINGSGLVSCSSWSRRI